MRLCERQTSPERYRSPEPPDYCENEALPGSDFCEVHEVDDPLSPEDFWPPLEGSL